MSSIQYVMKPEWCGELEDVPTILTNVKIVITENDPEALISQAYIGEVLAEEGSVYICVANSGERAYQLCHKNLLEYYFRRVIEE